MNDAADTSMTFRDMILRVAEAGNMCDYPEGAANEAAIPTDRHDLDLCKRSVRDGLEQFYRAHKKWSFLHPEVTLTMSVDGTGAANIQADPSRMRLPWYTNGASSGSITWRSSAGSYGGQVTLTNPERVRAAAATAPAQTGHPQLACILPSPMGVPVTTGDRQGWELRVWPKPSEAFTLTASFRVFPRRLEDLEERHVAGAPHDQTIVSYAIWTLKRRDAETNPGVLKVYKEEALEGLKQSILLDAPNAPRLLGRSYDSGIAADVMGGRRALPTGYWNGTNEYNGVAVNPGFTS